MAFDSTIWFLVLTLLAILFFAGAFLYFMVFDGIRKKTWLPRLKKSVFLEVSVPKDAVLQELEAQKEEKEMISVAEQFFATISEIAHKDVNHLLGIDEYISFEIAAKGKKISFYINTPTRLRSLIEKSLHAQYPKAQIDSVKIYNIFTDTSSTAGAELGLQKDSIFSFKTYKNMETDPINAMTNSLSKLGPDEGAAIQMLISPAGHSWQSRPRKVAHEIQQGKHPDDVTSSNFDKALYGSFNVMGNAIDYALGTAKQKDQNLIAHPENKHIQLTPMQQDMVKRLEDKSSKSGYFYNLRVVTSAESQANADLHLKNILASFMQYSMPPFNGFKVRKKKTTQVVKDYVFRIFHNTKDVLNTEELASLWHLPTKFTETPNIKWLGAKKAPPPQNLPDAGLLLGFNNYRSVKEDVYIKQDDRRRHTYIIGRTGTGKTELMKNMAIQDVRNGEGLCLIDPHGDLVEDVLQYIPKERAEDVIVFEPFNTDRPLGLNMLEVKDPSQKDFVIQEMISIFYKLFPPEMIGPMFEHNMRNVMLTLMEDEQYPGTIADIPRMFTDQDFQRYKLSKVQDPIVRSFWEKEMAKTSDFHKSEMLGYLISKVGRFVENSMMRNIIGQSQSAFDFRKVMDEGKILLINLSKGQTGEVNAKLLGLIIVSKLQMAAMSRADMPEDKRRDFYLYVDEFQNFVTDSFATILSEARKYRLNLIMAHQFISQLHIGKEGSSVLNSSMRDAVFGNTGTMISFRIGVEDAEVMAKEFAPVFNDFDVINIERFNAYIKLMIDGTASRPFNMQTYPKPKEANSEIAKIIKNLSNLKYGKPRSEIESEILERTKLGIPAQSGPAGVERSR
ncbi:MAG: type IV secretion system DNA-binding domain-containing protein [Candidatus Doudnabacteria bacterium]|nr:type IV secretion system DNA-binding domain-containing protein [Candidatus Doudnabacteria bacterium]